MAGAHGGGRGAGHRARGLSVRHAAGDVEPGHLHPGRGPSADGHPTAVPPCGRRAVTTGLPGSRGCPGEPPSPASNSLGFAEASA